ncbi:hypothetical protein ABPG72_022454 [Tetrahymena utriculariae]
MLLLKQLNSILASRKINNFKVIQIFDLYQNIKNNKFFQSFCKIGDQGLIDLSDKLVVFINLENLKGNFTLNSICDEGLFYLSLNLESLNSLIEIKLFLENNQINYEGMTSLLNSILLCKNLNILDFKNQLNQSTASYQRKFLKSKKLVQLSLDFE